ncbi:MAG: phospholipase D-like domain-containing protein [Bacteroidia bacterium]|nr:phospholipase D-like domain-containing protein [Bacteroidia bacterium]
MSTNLEALFRQAFEDGIFTKAERQALAQILLEEPLTDQARSVLHAKVFGIAAESMGDPGDRRILEWLETATRLLHPGRQAPAQPSGTQVYVSPGTECLHAIQSMLRSAREQMDICVFTISDDRITEEIFACHARGVQVRIITDDDKSLDDGSDIRRLARGGVPVRMDRTEYHMHHKFAVADQARVLTGSYNWTRSAAEYNEENLLITSDPAAVRRFSELFGELWEQFRADEL